MLGHLAYWFDSSAGAAWAAAAAVVAVGLAVLASRTWFRRIASAHSPRAPSDPAQLVPSTPGGPAERRQQPRRPDAPLAIVLSETDAAGKPVEGWVLNRSGGGLCLSLTQSFPAGMTLHLRLA